MENKRYVVFFALILVLPVLFAGCTTHEDTYEFQEHQAIIKNQETILQNQETINTNLIVTHENQEVINRNLNIINENCSYE